VIDQLISPGAGPLSAAIVQSGSYATNLPTLAQEEISGKPSPKPSDVPIKRHPVFTG